MVSSLGVALIFALSFSISLLLPALRASKISFLDRFMHGQEEMIQSLLAADEDAARMWVNQVFSIPLAIFAMAGKRTCRRTARSGMA